MVNIYRNITGTIYQINWLSSPKPISSDPNNPTNKFTLSIFSWDDFSVCVGICVPLDFTGSDKKIDTLYTSM